MDDLDGITLECGFCGCLFSELFECRGVGVCFECSEDSFSELGEEVYCSCCYLECTERCSLCSCCGMIVCWGCVDSEGEGRCRECWIGYNVSECWIGYVFHSVEEIARAA